MIKQLKRFKLVFIALIIPYVFLMFMLTYRIDYTLSAPGNLTIVDDQVVFETMYDTSGELNTVYVMSIVRPTFFMFMMSYFDDDIDSREMTFIEGSQTDAERIAYGFLQRDNAWNAAIITSYNALDIVVDYEVKLVVTRIFLDIAAIDQLEILDEIIAVNGDTENIRSSINAIGCDETFELTFKKPDGQIVSVDTQKQPYNNGCILGITIADYYDIIDVALEYTVRSNYIGGPSGGLMQFLHIYNRLTEADLTEGLRVAGTGGISLDGSVTSMGAIKQKVITAHYNDVDIFFVPRLNDDNPNDNYQIAMRTLETLDTDMIVVGVSDWLEAVTYLQERADAN